jgi:multiple sugar transport system substrate-binding protein
MAITWSRRNVLKGVGAVAVAHLPVMAILSACSQAAPTSAPAATRVPASGGGSAAQPTKPAAAGATTAPAASGAPSAAGGQKVQITFSHYLDPAAAKVYDGIIANEWAQKFPNIDVKVDISPEDQFTGKMLTQFGGGNYSDVVMVTDRYVPDFASRDVLIDFADRIKSAEPAYDFKDLNEDLVQSGQWNGKQVAIFDYTGPIVIYYNKRLFREAGVEPPKDKGLNWTFDEFTEVARKLARGEGEKRVWACEGYQTGFCFRDYPAEAMGGKILDHRGPAPADKVNWHWTTPEVKKSVQMETDWILKDKTVPAPGAVQGDPFQAQRVAMKIVAGRWLAPLYSSFSWADDLGMLYQPMQQGVPRKSRNGPRGLMIPKGSKNQDQAWEFIRFITSKEGMQLLFRANYSTPARKSLWEPFSKVIGKWEDAEIYQNTQKWMAELGALPTYPKFAAINKILGDNLNAIWLGQIPLDDGLKKMEDACNATMKQP